MQVRDKLINVFDCDDAIRAGNGGERHGGPMGYQTPISLHVNHQAIQLRLV
jgi:hypothetical protein